MTRDQRTDSPSLNLRPFDRYLLFSATILYAACATVLIATLVTRRFVIPVGASFLPVPFVIAFAWCSMLRSSLLKTGDNFFTKRFHSLGDFISWKRDRRCTPVNGPAIRSRVGSRYYPVVIGILALSIGGGWAASMLSSPREGPSNVFVVDDQPYYWSAGRRVSATPEEYERSKEKTTVFTLGISTALLAAFIMLHLGYSKGADGQPLEADSS